MSFRERLEDLASSIGLAATDAPDGYADWSSWTYETHMADLRDLWAQIRPQLKRDMEKAAIIDLALQEMFDAFEAGEKDRGRKAAWSVYNLDVKKLR